MTMLRLTAQHSFNLVHTRATETLDPMTAGVVTMAGIKNSILPADCTHDGENYLQGDTVCMDTGEGGVLAICGRHCNWTLIGTPCALPLPAAAAAAGPTHFRPAGPTHFRV